MAPQHAMMRGVRRLGCLGFDPLGPTVRSADVPSGRTLRYVDEGDPSWPALLFLGGAGTSVRACGLMEFARTLRELLGVRLVSVERTGLGQTPYDPTQGPAEYATDAWALLDQLGIGEVAVLGISGGGPYAGHVAAARPERVRSLHLACALSEGDAGPVLPFDAEEVIWDPVAWWELPEESPLHHVPGFVDSTVEEATRAAFARGRDSGALGLESAFAVYRHGRLPDLDAVRCPVFLYWGDRDATVPASHLERWRQLLPVRPVVRLYPGEGHDVQYRHWDQILCDVVHQGELMILSDEYSTCLVPAAEAEGLLAQGWTEGISAWR